MVLALGAGLPVSAQTPQQRDLQLVKVGFRYDPLAFPLVAADKLGFFAREGIRVEFVSLDASAAYTALLKGDVDVVSTITPAAVNLYLSGMPVRVIMKLADGQRTVIISKFGAKRIEDLMGKTVGMLRPTDAFYAFVFNDAVRRTGLSGKINVQLFGRFTAIMDALVAGKIDAAIAGESAGLEASSQGFGYNILSATKTPSRSGLVASERFLRNPDLVRRFVKSVHDGTLWLKSNPEDAIKMMGDYFSDVVYQRDVRPTMRANYKVARELWSTTGAWSDYDLLLLADYLKRPAEPSLIDPAYQNESLVAYLRQFFVNDYIR